VKGILLFMKYKINEIYKSYQGEGYNTGLEVIFIRFAGCNLKCPFCDTEFDSYKLMEVIEILKKVREYSPCKSIILTGGEPTIRNLEPLLKSLYKDYWIGLETNGTIDVNDISKYFNYITVSPKYNSVINQKNANEVRVVNYGITTDKLLKIKQTIKADYYFVSPLEQNGDFNIKQTYKLLNDIYKRGDKNWLMSLQTHKIAKIK
jgi:7-carboxy-7-deazaguanine synthase